ncbi:MAG: hypothetical protein DRP85_00645 [Candidatus Makaraimicrobium thalassicum]|nr:MAG: hypothetical protein DRP85_00645 [Candidatus Omnitrophota bacterium]
MLERYVKNFVDSLGETSVISEPSIVNSIAWSIECDAHAQFLCDRFYDDNSQEGETDLLALAWDVRLNGIPTSLLEKYLDAVEAVPSNCRVPSWYYWKKKEKEEKEKEKE